MAKRKTKTTKTTARAKPGPKPKPKLPFDVHELACEIAIASAGAATAAGVNAEEFATFCCVTAGRIAGYDAPNSAKALRWSLVDDQS